MFLEKGKDFLKLALDSPGLWRRERNPKNGK